MASSISRKGVFRKQTKRIVLSGKFFHLLNGWQSSPRLCFVYRQSAIWLASNCKTKKRTSVRDVLAWVTGFEPTNMNPSALTTLDSLILGEIDEFADDIVNQYNNFRIKEALIRTIRFANFLR